MNIVSNIRSFYPYFKESFLSAWNPTNRMITLVAVGALALLTAVLIGVVALSYFSFRFRKFLVMKDPYNLVNENLFDRLEKRKYIVESRPKEAQGYRFLAKDLPEGARLLMNNSYMTKRDLLLKAIRLDPAYVLNYHELAKTLPKDHEVKLHDGRKMSAKELYLEAIRIEPKADWAYYHLITYDQVVLPNGAKMTAEELLIEAVHLSPKALYYYMLGCLDKSVQLKNGTIMSSSDLFDEAKKLDPDFFKEAYTNMHRSDAKKIQNPAQKQNILLHLIPFNPTESMLYLDLASNLKKTGQGQVQLPNGTTMTKEELCLEAIKHNCKNGKAYYKLANLLPTGGHAVLLNGGKMSKVELYEEAIKLDAEYAQAYRNLGKILPIGTKAKISQGKEMTQQELYLKAIELNPRDPKGYHLLSLTVPEEGRIRLLNGKLMTKRELTHKSWDLED